MCLRFWLEFRFIFSSLVELISGNGAWGHVFFPLWPKEMGGGRCFDVLECPSSDAESWLWCPLRRSWWSWVFVASFLAIEFCTWLCHAFCPCACPFSLVFFIRFLFARLLFCPFSFCPPSVPPIVVLVERGEFNFAVLGPAEIIVFSFF